MADRVRVVPAYGDDGRSGAYQATGRPDGAAVAWIARTGAPVVAPPVLAGDTLIAADAGGAVYAFDAATGAERWRHAHRPYDDDLDDEYEAADRPDDDWIAGMDDDEPGIVTAPAVRDTRVFVEESESTGWVYVHDLRSGEVVATLKNGGCPTVVGDTLLIQEIGAGVRALRLPDLSLAWRSEAEDDAFAGWLRTAPATAGGIAYAALGYEPHHTHTGVTAFDLRTGELVFHRAGDAGDSLSFGTAHAVAADGLVWMPVVSYAAGDGSAAGRHRILGMDPRTGEERWAFTLDAGPAAEPAAVAVSGGTVYVAGERLHAVDVAAREIRWSAPLPADRVGPPVLAGGAVYLAGPKGTVSAFDVRDGSPRWSVETGEEIVGVADLQDDDALAYYEEEAAAVLPGDGVVYLRTAAGIVALR